jgi:hypothetical protein
LTPSFRVPLTNDLIKGQRWLPRAGRRSTALWRESREVISKLRPSSPLFTHIGSFHFPSSSATSRLGSKPGWIKGFEIHTRGFSLQNEFRHGFATGLRSRLGNERTRMRMMGDGAMAWLERELTGAHAMPLLRKKKCIGETCWRKIGKTLISSTTDQNKTPSVSLSNVSCIRTSNYDRH